MCDAGKLVLPVAFYRNDRILVADTELQSLPNVESKFYGRSQVVLEERHVCRVGNKVVRIVNDGVVWLTNQTAVYHPYPDAQSPVWVVEE